MKPTRKKQEPLPKPNELWPFTRVDAKILERMHREYLKRLTKPRQTPNTDVLEVHSKLNSSPLSSMFPFISFDLTSDKGILYG